LYSIYVKNDVLFKLAHPCMFVVMVSTCDDRMTVLYESIYFCICCFICTTV